VKRFSFGPTLAVRGRRFKGLRGFGGKPFHPPLTDIPIAAYVFAAAFDVLSVLLRDSHPEVATELFRAATWVLVGGAAVSVLAALTGWADWASSSEPGTQARRTINSHAILMILGTLLVLADLAIRLTAYQDEAAAPLGLAALTVLVALIVAVGASYGGTLVFDYGFNVETAGDSPVWHKSETDVYPADKAGAGSGS
jgi:uncharacterized membrane protein